MLTGITITCFSASYLIVLALELSRLFGRVPYRMLLLFVMLALGLFTHSLYLFNQGRQEIAELGTQSLLGSWHDWSLLIALGLVAFYSFLLIRRPDTSIGMFILPLVLALIGLSWIERDAQPFSRATTLGLWGIVHGVSLLAGTMLVTLGFAFGLMYLVHSYQLKHKNRRPRRFRLPSLEYLQTLNRLCLLLSTILLALGVLSGIVLNLNSQGRVGWTEGGVLVSLLLFAWLVGATILDQLYQSSGPGRRVAYLTLVSFGFLVLALLAVVASPHGRSLGNVNSSLEPTGQPVPSLPAASESEASR